MLKKLVVAILACITLFLSQRAVSEPRMRGADQGPEPRADRTDARETAADTRPARTAVLF